MLSRDGMKKDDDDYDFTPFQGIEKGAVLQETRLFNETPLNSRKCCHLLTKLLYLLAQGETFTSTEATDAFFTTTKLFQSQDVVLRRMTYLVLKELTPYAEDVIIVIASLTKDMNSRTDIYRANSLRVLCNILTDVRLIPDPPPSPLDGLYARTSPNSPIGASPLDNNIGCVVGPR